MHPPKNNSETAAQNLPARPRRLLAMLLTLGVLTALLPATVAAAATPSKLAVQPQRTSYAKVGPKRVTSIVQVSVAVPRDPVEFGLQLRAKSKKSGYRAQLAVSATGAVTASFSRVKSSKATRIGAKSTLGFTVKQGERIHLETTVVAKKTVRLYLRAWKDGQAKPAQWQLAASDKSKKRIRVAGKSYLWVRTSGSEALTLQYTKEAAGRFSAARAAQIGVASPASAGGATGSTTPSAPATPATPEDSDDTFSIAVVPDTQKETHDPKSVLLLNRSNWIVSHRQSLDLRYVLHTGDVTNWGWLDEAQFTRVKAAMGVIKNAGIPYDVTIGNHDTAAVGWNGIKGSTGYGGSAYASNPECPTKLGAAACNTKLLVRNTDAFNQTFPLSSITNVGGAYEAGKIDNNWTTFSAGDTKWLVLTLELWPRTDVVAWAKKVVEDHPNHNVLIQTHHYLDDNATVSGSAGGYGANSPAYLYDQIVSKYKNVKMVFSGHTGSFNNRSDSPNGNKVLSFLGNELGSNVNPVRIVTINTRTGAVTSTIQNPIAGTVVGSTSDTISIER